MGFSLRSIRRGKHSKLMRAGALMVAGATIGTAGMAIGSAQAQATTAQRLRYRNGVVPACVDIMTGALRLVVPIPPGMENNPPAGSQACDPDTEYTFTWQMFGY